MQESAIKFVSYEQSKRFLAKYWDCVSDVSELSSSSRFFAGGVGGITSQFAIYGLETLKTRVQSEIGPAQGMKAVKAMARTMWQSGGIRAYYRGLTLGLVGVFPYSAIDMGTYETLRRYYCKSMKVDEPGVMATLSFGALSGSIGAASVYRMSPPSSFRTKQSRELMTSCESTTYSTPSGRIIRT
jgi:solute carrier family 25 phosphate transporter 23/24/25/41